MKTFFTSKGNIFCFEKCLGWGKVCQEETKIKITVVHVITYRKIIKHGLEGEEDLAGG